MKLLGVEMWALWCACGLMAVVGVINARTLMVPNRLSLPAILAGWVVAGAVSLLPGVPSDGGGLRSSLAASAVGLLLLLPFYAGGWLGAGCVKMQMAFGAWVGCALAVVPGIGLTTAATLLGGVLTVIGAVLAAKQSVPGDREEPEVWLFPAQATLSLGSIAAVVTAFALGWL